MSFQLAVAGALERAQSFLAEQFHQILVASSELELQLRMEAAEIAEQRHHLEERAKELEREHELRREELELEFREKTAAVEEGRLRLEEERAHLARGTGPEDVISLSLGGEKFLDVQRATLCQCEESLFGAMFSGRWDQHLDRDKSGRVLLDFSPSLLVPLIDHLRSRRCCVDPPTAGPKPPPGMEADFMRMLGYYGMEQFVVPSSSMDEGQSWSWDPTKSLYHVFSEDQREMEATGSSPVFGSVDFGAGCHAWAVKLLRGNFVCIGVGTHGTQRGMPQPYGKTALVYDCCQGIVDGALRLTGLEKAQSEDTIGVRLDITCATISFFKNGAHLADATLTALIGAPYIPIMGLWGGSRARLVSTNSVQ